MHTATAPPPHCTNTNAIKVLCAFDPRAQGNTCTCLSSNYHNTPFALISVTHLDTSRIWRTHHTTTHSLNHKLQAPKQRHVLQLCTTMYTPPSHLIQHLHYSHLATVHITPPTTSTPSTQSPHRLTTSPCQHANNLGPPPCTTPHLSPRHYAEGCGTCGLAMSSLALSAAARPSCGVRGSCTSDTSR